MQPQFVKLKTKSDWQEAAFVLKELRPNLKVDDFVARREVIQSEGVQLVGIRVGDKLVCVASYLIYPHLTHEHDCWIHDMATLESFRHQGFATRLLEEIQNLAGEKGCYRVLVHTRNENKAARALYGKKAGFKEYATVFQQLLR